MPTSRYTSPDGPARDPDALAITPVTKCCGKYSFATENVAEAFARLFTFLAARGRPARAYRCPNGWHHITSKPTNSRHYARRKDEK